MQWNVGKSSVIEVAQVGEEREKWGKENPFVEWAREEVGVDVSFRHRQVCPRGEHRSE